MASSEPDPSKKPSTLKGSVTRNALRYTISEKEYELLHQYLLSRSSVLRKRAPPPLKDNDSPQSRTSDYNAATIRISLRLLLASYSGLKVWDLISEKLLARGSPPSRTKTPFWKSPNFRLSLSLSSILFFHRILHRFFIRLRDSLRTDDAKSFRRRNPRTWRALTSKLTPAIGASLSGLFLGLSPADQTRLIITIYLLSRSLEFYYNNLENRGYFKDRPWWFGSWLLVPFAMGQLLHSFVLDRDCFPAAYGSFILKRSPEYIQTRPATYPSHLPWPSTFDIVDSLGTTSKQRWPSFTSPILFPKSKPSTRSLAAVAPITGPAHPAIKNLSCAVLHPNDPSCSRTYLKYFITAFPSMARFFTLIYSAFAILRYRAFLNAPVASLNDLAFRVLRISFFIVSAIGTAWSSICFLQRVLPGSVLPTERWFVSGFLAGLWAFVVRGAERGNFLYTARASMDSLWKVGRKKGWWKGVKNGDVLLFAACLTLVNVVYERDPAAISGPVVRKGMGVVRGDGWVDRLEVIKKKKEEEVKAKSGEQVKKDI